MHYDHPKDCESIQVERLCFANDQRLLLRGFCIPDEPLAENSRFLVIMEQLNQQKLECPDANMQQRYHLTEREQMVIIYLMLGFTNKEIANRINLSEYTVKEHLKRIMHKTQTTTRTGLLARMIFPTPEGAVPDVLSKTIEIQHHLLHPTLKSVNAVVYQSPSHRQDRFATLARNGTFSCARSLTPLNRLSPNPLPTCQPNNWMTAVPLTLNFLSLNLGLNFELFINALRLAHARVSPRPRARTLLWPSDLSVALADLFDLTGM